MRLLYLSDSAIPSRATNAMQVLRMCAAFQRSGAEVTLVRPAHLGRRPEGYEGDIWAFYGIDPIFAVTTLPTPMTATLERFGRAARAVRLLPLAAYLAWKSRPGGEAFVCYTRSFLGAWVAVHARRWWKGQGACCAIVAELHDAPVGDRAWAVLDDVDGIVTISGALRTKLVGERPQLAPKTWVEHDGADLHAALPQLTTREARRRLGLDPGDRLVLGYTGRVIAGKGTDVLLAAADRLRDLGVHILVVGKVYDPAWADAARLRDNVTFTGFVPPSDIPVYLAAADMLVMPTTPDLAYAAYTSPLKLFEYMASGRPIVASNLASVREVLDDGGNAVLYEAGSADDLVDAVGRLVASPSLSRSLALHALQGVGSHAWDARARRIIERIDSLIVDGHETPRASHDSASEYEAFAPRTQELGEAGQIPVVESALAHSHRDVGE